MERICFNTHELILAIQHINDEDKQNLISSIVLEMIDKQSLVDNAVINSLPDGEERDQYIDWVNEYNDATITLIDYVLDEN